MYGHVAVQQKPFLMPERELSGGPGLPVVVLMGVSGAGKSRVGAVLARRLRVPFLEGDMLHPPQNRAKMASGQPLDDADRAPWLDAVAVSIGWWLAAGCGGVVACSALKRRYRDRLVRPGVALVYLKGAPELIRSRLLARRGHFMPASLLDSQFATLEEPGPEEHALVVDAALPPERLVARISDWLAAGIPPARA